MQQPRGASATVITCDATCRQCYGSGASQCTKCEDGYYLDEETCLTYDGTNDTECDNTDASTDNYYFLDERDMRCKRTINDIDNPCEPSTYNQNAGASLPTSCQTCAPGKACETFAQAASTSECLAGYYCMSGSTMRSPYRGYSDDIDELTKTPVDAVDAYTDTDPETVPINGVTNWWKISDVVSPAGDVCERGNWCGNASTQMTTCYAGFYCPDPFMKAHDDSLKCRDGHYCSGSAYSMTPGNLFYNAANDDTTGGRCRVGSYCPEQSSKEFACDSGSFMPYEMAYDVLDCIACPEGKYCDLSGMSDLSAQDCEAGYYCEQSATTGRQNQCTYDEKCVSGTLYPEQCAPEEYTISTKADSCDICGAGNRCASGVIEQCVAGTFCLDNTISYCTPGTYGENTAIGESTQNDACTNCEAGSVCMQPNDRFNCADGFTCTGNSDHPRPNKASEGGGICPPGTFCSTSGVVTIVTEQDCTPGMYCPNWANAAAEGQCFAGYYCYSTGVTSKATAPDQNKCPAGHYCLLGASEATECPKGTYNEGEGGESRDHCKSCPEGVQCLSAGLSTAPIYINPSNSAQTDVCSVSNPENNGGSSDGDSSTIVCPDALITTCPLGSYCDRGTDGTTSNGAKDCEAGYKCAGTRAQILCEAGTYQDEDGQSVCKQCGIHDLSKGYYCDGQEPDQEGTECPAGRYCPLGTKYADEYPCLAGTYFAGTGAKDSSECTACDVGYFCQFEGQTSSSTQLFERYHGNNEQGHLIPDPYLCPQAFYCAEGSDIAVPCDDGQWTPSKGASKKDQCIPCSRGKWCQFATMFADSNFKTWMTTHPDFDIAELTDGSTGFSTIATYYGDCEDGYICYEGSTVSDPALPEGKPCPVGHYCPTGVKIEIPCPPGFIQADEQSGSCDPCPITKYCPSFGMTEGIECDAGFYCPGTTSTYFYDGTTAPPTTFFIQIRSTPCPAGTMNSPAGSGAIGNCIDCTAGFYCDTPGSIQYTNVCAAGFVCGAGNDREGPYVTSYSTSGDSGKCTAGNYCTAGVTSQQTCPTTTYSISDQTTECLTCPPGNYCKGSSQINSCQAGYYCSSGSDVMAPTATANPDMGDICPTNHFCEAAAGLPWQCPDGTLQTSTGQQECDPCDDGYICTNGGTKTSCPAYHYCDGDTDYPLGKLCDNGFYGEEGVTRYDSIDDCLPCIEGQFCTAGRIVGDCAPGYICVEQADAHTPDSEDLEDKAYPCPLGFYCPEGAQEPIKCPPATFTFELAAKQETECTICQMGWYCPFDKNIPYICPEGAYCGFSSFEPTLCPIGSYQPFEEMGHLLDCLPCKAGYNCYEEGIGNIVSKGDKYKCPDGYFCPKGYDIKPIPCIAGSYIDGITTTTQSISFEQVFIGSEAVADDIEDCSFCPRGFTCPTGTGFRYSNPCPPGAICPAGSGFRQLCPPGWYCQGEGDGKIESAECPEGYYCPAGTEVPNPCGAEEVCPRKSASPATRGKTPEDCEPGTYLNVDRCVPCEPGFVCDWQTSQKYPIDFVTEGGYECPPGNYCPRGTTSETIKKCPVGTHRVNPKGITVDDCDTCPENSSSNREGARVCILCGRGSASSEDRSTCNCVGAYRTWQESTNSCVCQQGFYNPVITEESQTSTQDLDCRPIMEPICSSDQFVNEDNKCVPKSSCADYCSDGKGVYDSELENCFCNGQDNNPDFYCDADCQFSSLKVYFTQDSFLEMEANGVNRVFATDDFGDKFFFAGMTCPIKRCSIMSQKLVDGKMVASAEASQDFVDFWRDRIDSNYKSSYPSRRRDLSAYYFDHEVDINDEENSFMTKLQAGDVMNAWNLDELGEKYSLEGAYTQKFQTGVDGGIVRVDTSGLAGDSAADLIDNSDRLNDEPIDSSVSSGASTVIADGTASYIERTIQCVLPGEGVSFEVDPERFPHYIITSKFNTDPNYDYGAFSTLETKLLNAKLAISSFLVNFPNEGVYAFGNNQVDVVQTIVLVTNDFDERCFGVQSWPMTSNNMRKLDIVKGEVLLRSFDYWLHYIPSFFILVAFAACGLQHIVESRIEAAELERRLKRENASHTLKKYFKKKQDKFDKVTYLADMYKLIKQTVEEIKRQIADNKRRTEQEDRDNMNAMLQNKYSLMNDLLKSGGDKDINIIKQKVSSMLTNLRFTDGRSLNEVLENMKIQEQIEHEEETLKKMEEDEKAAKQLAQSDSFVSESLSGDSEDDSFLSKSSKTGSKQDDDAEKDDSQDADQIKANADQADDMLAHKAALRKKREDFIASMDENLSPAQKEAMIKSFDNQMVLLGAAIQKEQQDQDAKLQAKLNARRRNNKKIAHDANRDVMDKQIVMTEIQDRIDQMIVDKEQLEERGVNTKVLKGERDEEYKNRIETMEKEQDQKMRAMREEYLAKIKATKNPAEKDKLLEEMGKRLKNVEANLLDERKRQEAQLMKMLKSRQKKALGQKGKDMTKHIEELEDEIDKLKNNMDSEKALLYSEKGSAIGILDQDIAIKKEKITNSLDNKFKGFQNDLTQVEKDDIEIHKTQLQMMKEKELNGAVAEIDEEVNKSSKQRQLSDQKEILRKKLDDSMNVDPSEKNRMMAELSEIERNLAAQIAQDRANQDKNLDEKLKKRQQLLQLKKMQIEADQINELNAKETETMNNKFLEQMDQMDKHAEKDVEREVRNILTRVGPGKEQALIVVNEAHDDLLDRKLRILMTKQFGDLTKYLGSMQSKLAMENMIRARKIEMKFERDKEDTINAGLPEAELGDRLQMHAAERDLELQISNQKMERDKEEREQKVREEIEEKFCDEKKDLVTKQAQAKAGKLRQVMNKFPDNDVMQDVGHKLIKRIDNSVEEDIAEAEKQKEANLEIARMKIIAENDKQLDDLQRNLNEAMSKEEKKLDDQMNARRDQILTLKRANLEERLKMAGDMTQDQIKELRGQYEREYANLEKAITEEKLKQLTNMRSAMLSRRIAKERKRRLEKEAEEASRDRAKVQKMNSELAKAFRTMIAKKLGQQNALKQGAGPSLVDGEDRLRARLAAWQRAVDEARGYRGGDDGEIWNVGDAREAEKVAKAEARRQKELEKAEKDKKIAYTVQELYKRIMRVERLSEMLESQGIQLPKTLSTNLNYLRGKDAI